MTFLKNGKYNAIIRENGHIKTKTFLRKSSARSWEKIIEAEIERNAVDSSRIQFSNLVKEYLKQLDLKDYTGKLIFDES